MPKFRVVALEKFIVRTVYHNVEAPNAKAAATRCRKGREAYESHTIEEGDEEWLETVSVRPEVP